VINQAKHGNPISDKIKWQGNNISRQAIGSVDIDNALL
jgi:hypothetical protein